MLLSRRTAYRNSSILHNVSFRLNGFRDLYLRLICYNGDVFGDGIFCLLQFLLCFWLKLVDFSAKAVYFMVKKICFMAKSVYFIAESI